MGTCAREGSAIRYTTDKEFTKEQIVALFRSVGWHSADYPSRLFKALMGSSLVITAWDGDALVGLARALDDGELVAYLKYLLVEPSHQGAGIASRMLRMVREHYRDYLYIDVMPDERRNAAFYQRNGFSLLQDGAALQICNDDPRLAR